MARSPRRPALRSPPTRTSARSPCSRNWRPRAASSGTRAASARSPRSETGRGEHLVVERGYYAPAVKSRGELVPVDGMPGVLKGADVVDDAVDDVIETVLEYGGEVTFVSDGFLVDHGRIALVTRY